MAPDKFLDWCIVEAGSAHIDWVSTDPRCLTKRKPWLSPARPGRIGANRSRPFSPPHCHIAIVSRSEIANRCSYLTPTMSAALDVELFGERFILGMAPEINRGRQRVNNTPLSVQPIPDHRENFCRDSRGLLSGPPKLRNIARHLPASCWSVEASAQVNRLPGCSPNRR